MPAYRDQIVSRHRLPAPDHRAADLPPRPARDRAAHDDVPAWDLPTRLFHAALVVVVALGWLTHAYGDAGRVWHKWNGYAMLALVVFRVIWGFVGGSTARFAAFLPTPRRLGHYLRALAQGRYLSFLGHNPLGALMIFALLGLAMAQAVSGLFARDAVLRRVLVMDRAPDAIVDLFTRFHAVGFYLMLSLATMHAIANVTYGMIGRDNLLGAMIGGRKPARDYTDMRRSDGGSPALAAAVLGVSVVIVLAAIVLAGGRL